jgi:hypothetical protein
METLSATANVNDVEKVALFHGHAPLLQLKRLKATMKSP